MTSHDPAHDRLAARRGEQGQHDEGQSEPEPEHEERPDLAERIGHAE
ncbi:MAG: hypothetical protein WKF78_04795 [Candidatus Limnocylindrales bacterium]